MIFILTGCTAVGKTSLSLKLAQRLNASILSCDSVQVYRGADIGSDKVPQSERQGVEHYGLDLCNLDEEFDVVQYSSYAKSVIEKLTIQHKNVLIVGGTGFYLKSFFQNISDGIFIPEAVKFQVGEIFQKNGLLGLQNEISRFGACDFNHSDWNNPRRLQRCLEKLIVTGKSQNVLKEQFNRKISEFSNFPKKVIQLERSDENLLSRARLRIDSMISGGLIQEVENLNKQYRLSHSLQNAIGYRESLSYIKNQENDPQKLAEDIFFNTKKLIKKQKTWFRTQIKADMICNLDLYSANESFDFIFSFCKTL